MGREVLEEGLTRSLRPGGLRRKYKPERHYRGRIGGTWHGQKGQKKRGTRALVTQNFKPR